MFSLRRTLKPAIDPVSVSEVKLYTHITHDVEDSRISEWIKAGCELAEDFQRRSYYTQKWELSLDGWWTGSLHLPRPPILSVESVKYYGTDNAEHEFPLTDLIVDLDAEPARLAPAYGVSWPTTMLRDINAVKIAYKAGYADADTVSSDMVLNAIPSAVKDAICFYCAWRNEHRAESPLEPPWLFYSILMPQRIFRTNPFEGEK